MHFIILPTASSMVSSIKFIKYRKNLLTVTRYVQNVHQFKLQFKLFPVFTHYWHEHKHVSVLAVGQLHPQSATAPSLVTHAAVADAVTAHKCHESDSHVIFTSHVK